MVLLVKYESLVITEVVLLVKRVLKCTYTERCKICFYNKLGLNYKYDRMKGILL